MLLGAILATSSAALSQSGAQTGGNSSTIAGGTTLNAELSASVDSKKAKSGDKVTAQVTEAVKADGVTMIPKGAKLFGSVTEATARANGDPGSALGIHFEKVVLKNGQEMPVNVWIRALAAEPRNAYQPGPEQNTLAGTPGAGASPMGSTRSSMGGPPAGAGAPAVGVTNASADDGTNAGDKTPGAAGGLNAAGQLSANSRGVFGMDGVRLENDASNPAQGSLITSSKKNVRLDSGTRLLLVFLAEVSATPNK